MAPSLVANYANKFTPLEVETIKPIDNTAACVKAITKVDKTLDDQKEGRLFAVILLLGKQYKVTAGDILVVEGYWPPTIGEQLKLEKVGGIILVYPVDWLNIECNLWKCIYVDCRFWLLAVMISR